MTAPAAEIEKRTQAALAAIRKSAGTEEAEYGTDLFTSHHLEELDADYWQQHLGTRQPQPAQVLDLLILRSHWGDDEHEMQTFDFTLPGEVTDYVLSVRFDEAGEVEGISMES